MKLGSLFDGSGGFPLAAIMCGIKPVWASEVEKFPIQVTSKRFPEMLHIGDITKINGADIEPVDIITFGSPCQDLSTAGKRKGLGGERSGLFMEAIRITTEMRLSTNGIYPAFIVWENVYGAFSSNVGRDFQTVLERIAQVAETACHIPKPPMGWTGAGAIMGGGFSIAWRLLDAQFWGVPQRRRRIFLVADFRGCRAPEILFKRPGMQRDFKAVGKDEGKIAANTDRCPREAVQPKEYFGDPDERRRLRTNDRRADDSNAEAIRFFSRQGFGDYAQNVVSSTLMASHTNDESDLLLMDAIRQLTPLEYCRLQGFPDWWCAETDGSDSAQYKMWGNGVALPCVLYIMEGLAEALGA